MGGPYNPQPGSRPGERPQCGGYPGSGGCPQQGHPGYAGPGGLASLPIGSAGLAFRVLAPAAGVVGIVVTLLALNTFWDKANVVSGDLGVFKHSAAGLYLTLIGFLIGGVAGVFGPRRA